MITVMSVSRSEPVLAALSRYVAADENLELVAQAPGGEAALEKVENVSPDILLINSSSTDADAINLAERVILRKPRTFVIVLVEEMTLEAVQSANAAGCHNVLRFPASARELCDNIHRIYNAESGRIGALDTNQRVTWSSKVITVFGAKGGLGKTTLATNLALRLAALNKKVAIVDLDLQFGDVHIFLDLDPKETISDLVQDMNSPTIDSVRSYMSIHPSGVHVLCAPKSPEYAEIVSGDRIASLLSLLRSYYDYVIIDTATSFSDPTIAALEASSTILFVTGLDISILKNSKLAMNILESLGLKKKIRTVINRAVEINSITIADVQSIVDAPILARIPSDYMVAVAALNQGQPFIQSAPKSKLSLAVSDIADKIVAGTDNFDIQQLSAKEKRALMRRYKTKEKSEKKSGFGFSKS